MHFLFFHHFDQSLTKNPWIIMVGWCWDICRAWYHLQFRLWIHHFGCLDHKLWSLEVGTKLSKFSNLEKILSFSRLPFLQVILFSWSILVQMTFWTIFWENSSYEDHFDMKFDHFDFRLRAVRCGETLIPDFLTLYLLTMFWLYNWFLRIILSILIHFLKPWLIFLWKFSSGDLSRPKP